MRNAELDRWNDHPVATWAREWHVPALRVFRTVGSTNDVAGEMAADGAAEGTLVLADEQTKGRGRRGRAWTAPRGASLSMSMVFRPPTVAASRMLTLRLGIAAARALGEILPLSVALKWPNDLVLDHRKLGGILCEASLADVRVDYVIAGIGLNLRPPDDGWPPEIAGRATSLLEAVTATAAPPAAIHAASDAAGLAGRIAAAWRGVAAEPRDTLSQEERDAFRTRDALRGREVTVDGRTTGVAEGITPTGALRLRGDHGLIEITAGTVRATDTMAGERA